MELNYTNTFIAAAEDCKAASGKKPEPKGEKPTAAVVQYQMLVEQPYRFTQEDILFASSAAMRENPNVTEGERTRLRKDFFSRAQACLRASPMGKTYGWGIHFNAEGKAAAFGVETSEYAQFAKDSGLYQTRAMRTKRA